MNSTRFFNNILFVCAGPDPDPLIEELFTWALDAQAVSAVELQALMVDIKRARRLPVLSIIAAPGFLARLLAAANSTQWKVRMAAVLALQPFWHRCCSITSVSLLLVLW